MANANPANLNKGTKSERCIARSKVRIRESNELIENSRVARLASSEAAKVKREQKAAAKAAKAKNKPAGFVTAGVVGKDVH